MAPSLILVNSKGDRVELDFKLNVHVRLISSMIKSLELQDKNQPIEIPVGDSIDGETLQLIKRYLELLDQNVQSENSFINELDEDSLYK